MAEIRCNKLTQQQINEISLVLTESLSSDPLFQAVFKNDLEKHVFIKFLVKYCNILGEVHLAEDLSGAALWVPPNTSLFAGRNVLRGISQGMLREFSAFVFRLSFKTKNNLKQLFSFIEDKNSLDMKHYYYLVMIGVSKDKQGHGIGKSLMNYALARFGEGSLYYLENSSPKNLKFYNEFKFKVLSQGEFKGATIFLMARNPKLI